jgi:hypothetical protein
MADYEGMHGSGEGSGEEDRRSFLMTCGKFALTVPPVMTVLLSTSLSSPAIAKSGGGGKTKGNNGVGNGEDPQPPGNPPINDGPGTSPGSPGNQGGANGKP